MVSPPACNRKVFFDFLILLVRDDCYGVGGNGCPGVRDPGALSILIREAPIWIKSTDREA